MVDFRLFPGLLNLGAVGVIWLGWLGSQSGVKVGFGRIVVWPVAWSGCTAGLLISRATPQRLVPLLLNVVPSLREIFGRRVLRQCLQAPGGSLRLGQTLRCSACWAPAAPDQGGDPCIGLRPKLLRGPAPLQSRLR